MTFMFDEMAQSLSLTYDAIDHLQMVDFAAAMAKSAAAAAATAAVEDHDGDSGESVGRPKWPMMKVSRNVGRSVIGSVEGRSVDLSSQSAN